MERYKAFPRESEGQFVALFRAGRNLTWRRPVEVRPLRQEAAILEVAIGADIGCFRSRSSP